MTWPGVILRGLLYGTIVVVTWPALVLLRVDPRIDYAEDLEYGRDR